MFSCTCALLHSVPTRFGTVTTVWLRSSPSVAMPRYGAISLMMLPTTGAASRDE